MEQLVFILVVAVISLINWLLKRKAEQDKQSSAPLAPPPPAQRPAGGPLRSPEDDEQERLRKFLEALGVPQAPPPRQPPPPVRQPPPVPPTPRRMAAPPPARPMAAPVQPRRPHRTVVVSPPEKAEQDKGLVIAPLMAPGRMSQGATALGEVAPAMVVTTHEHSALATAGAPAADLRAALASHEGLRAAVLAREILGPPRGLQPLGRCEQTIYRVSS
jgi:hypothetical protein